MKNAVDWWWNRTLTPILPVSVLLFQHHAISWGMLSAMEIQVTSLTKWHPSWIIGSWNIHVIRLWLWLYTPLWSMTCFPFSSWLSWPMLWDKSALQWGHWSGFCPITLFLKEGSLILVLLFTVPTTKVCPSILIYCLRKKNSYDTIA